MLISLGIISGIVIKVVNDGEVHKDEMMRTASPPPPSARRELFETGAYQRATSKGPQFVLHANEKAALSLFARRGLQR